VHTNFGLPALNSTQLNAQQRAVRPISSAATGWCMVLSVTLPDVAKHHTISQYHRGSYELQPKHTLYCNTPGAYQHMTTC
jgi:hypothetical protein